LLEFPLESLSVVASDFLTNPSVVGPSSLRLKHLKISLCFEFSGFEISASNLVSLTKMSVCLLRLTSAVIITIL
jgi:hypothetical protein